MPKILSAAGAIVAVLLLFLWLITGNSKLSSQLTAAEQRAMIAEGVVKTMQRDQAAQEESRKELHAKLQMLQRNTQNHQKHIEDLLNENAELKEWASRPVPAVIAERLQRPASTGVSHYQQQLSRRSSVYAQPDPANQ